jgi:hypothetical protein
MLNLNRQKGFAGLLVTILITAVVMGIAASIFLLTYNEQKILRNVIKSSQAYYTAEAGIEDALLRLKKNLNWENSYSFNVDDSIATIEISDIIGGSRVITAEGNAKKRARKIEVAYEINSEKISFHYGAQVDEGGMLMRNNSEIKGNIFSNGSILLSGGGTGIITGDVAVASTSTVYGNNKIQGLEIGEESGANAYTYSCQDCEIGGKLYLSGGSEGNCTAGGGIVPSETISKKDLPITQEQINGWEAEAGASEIYVGDYIINGGDTESFGPRKIDGSLTMENNTTLIMEGTIWVTGTTTIGNNATIELDSNAYGSKSGVLLVDDGRIIIENGAELFGSGAEGSYLMLLSTNISQMEESPAIYVKNNAMGAILYSTKGLIILNNNMKVREVTGYKILLQPNAEIEYQAGLIDTLFSAGPGGSWKVTSWKEVE